MLKIKSILTCALSALTLFALCSNVLAQESKKSLTLELNNARQVEGSCRVSFMFHNELGGTVEDIGMEVAILDKSQMTQEFLLINTGRLTNGKRRVLQYDLADLSCENIGTILINDVSDCQMKDMTAADCLDSIRPTSLIDIKLSL